MTRELSEVLKEARQTYGNKKQILVCMEELNELAAVLAKFPRYDSEEEAVIELYQKTLDEVADVTIILEHVKAIYNMPTEDINDRIGKKLERLNRWLSHSDSSEETVHDRYVRK